MAPKSVTHKQANLKNHFIKVKTEPTEHVVSFPKLTSKPPYSPHQPPQLYTGERYLIQEEQVVLPLNRNEAPDFFPLLVNDVYAKIREKRTRYQRQFSIKKDSIKKAMDSVNRFWHLNKPCKYLYDNLSNIYNSDDLLWTEKYRPKSIKGLLSNKGVEILGFLQSSKLGQQNKPLLYLLVGPSGTGKSASVQTAAQEAGYEIFESNPLTKRSGKDLLHQLGEMTSSHLVGFDNVERVNRKKRKETIILKDNVVLKKKKRKVLPGHNDMMHYFQKVSLKSEEEEEMDIEINQTEIQQADSDQSENNEEEEMDEDLPLLQPPKQSLVLLEEVDILYEEDKGFWPAVKELCEKSKRPIIMTCNDITKIPSDILDIIEQTIYFKAPEKHNLTSYLQLISLSEGFFIPVNDLSRLVQLYDCDTRRLIHTLQFWCRRKTKQDEHYVYEGFYKEVTGVNDVHPKNKKKENDDPLELMYAKIESACSIDTWVAQENKLEQHFNAIDQYYPTDILDSLASL